MSGMQLQLEPLREPLGLVRALQWFFSIFAFSTVGGYGGAVSFRVSCFNQSEVTVSAAFAYPFRLNEATFSPSLAGLCNHTWAQDVHLVGDFSSGAQFFVGVAAVAFLGSMGAMALYLAYMHLYRRAGARLPLLDFLCTVALSFLWLVSSSAWAKALGDIRTSTGAPLPGCDRGGVTCVPNGNPPMGSLNVSVVSDGDNGRQGDIRTSTSAPLPGCDRGGVTCVPNGNPPMGSLNVSVIFGFLNLLLWVGSSWFVYKETEFHRPAPPPATPAV
ncbi:synaptophysin-like protein 1 [Patagioenas fasciata]|uniref:synaptophysin-like protein 1 n=1 Tax=Patagioenas fasciata TaxID=372321 RepID=UPI003A9925BB